MTPQRKLSTGSLQALLLILFHFTFHPWVGCWCWWKASPMHIWHWRLDWKPIPQKTQPGSPEILTGCNWMTFNRIEDVALHSSHSKGSRIFPSYYLIMSPQCDIIFLFSKIKCNHRSLPKKYKSRILNENAWGIWSIIFPSQCQCLYLADLQ